jgi:N utilization substance protein A
MVEEDQLSLAIGKGGQNVRLASRLTGWRINIREINEAIGPAASEGEVPAAEGTPENPIASASTESESEEEASPSAKDEAAAE